MDYCVITFSSTHAAISAQKLLEGVCPIQVMPVLREISKGCGISIRLSPADLSAAQSALERSPLLPEEYAFFAISGTGPGLSARPIVPSPPERL